MIDLHCHVLPDIDDGARDLDDAVRMVEMARDDGIETIVATPHMLNGVWDVTVASARDRHALLADELASRGIDVTVELGAEVHLDASILEATTDGDVLTLGGSRALLLELPAGSIPTGSEEVIFELQATGFTIVLAHPERNHELMRTPDRAERLRERGVRLQVTARSVTGGFGHGPKKAARRWLKRRVVDVLATDAHNPRGRIPLLSEAAAWVARKLGAEYADQLTVGTPAALLSKK